LGDKVLELLKDNNHSFIIVGTAKDKIDKMADALKNHFKAIFDKLITHSKKLPKSFLKFLASLSEEGNLLPDDYFTPFELRRLKFTYYGCLRKTTSNETKIALTGILLFRLFIYRVLMRPSTSIHAIPDLEKKE
jgi:hypothetical protein